MKILLTAFEPFAKRTKNTSQEVLMRVDDTRTGSQVVKRLLPVDTVKGPAALVDIFQNDTFQAVVCLGEAGSIRWVQLERLAVNWLDFPIADNAGAQIIDQLIAPNGPTAYFSTLPIRKFEQTLTACDIPVRISMSAGTYLCNQVFYTLMHFLNEKSIDIPAGFIHLPVYSWNHKEGEPDVTCGNREYQQIAGAIDKLLETLATG